MLVEPVVSPQDFVYTKFVTTVIAIVPISMIADFQRDYAIITEYVIPGSARRLNVP